MTSSKPAVTENEFNEWKNNPVTEMFFKTMRDWKEELKELWASGAFTDQTQHGQVILNAKAVGCCEVVDRVVNIEYEQLIESEKANGE